MSARATIIVVMNQAQERKIATSWERISLAYLSLILYLVLGLSVYNALGLKEIQNYLLLVFILSILDTLVLAYSGYGLAGFIIGLKVVRHHALEGLGLKRASMRFLFSIVSVLLLGLGYIAALFNSENRTMQDIAVDALVIKKPIFAPLSNFLALLLSLISIIITPLIPVTIGLAGFMAVKSAMALSTNSYYSSAVWEADSAKVAQISLTNNQLIALSRLDGVEPDYLPFKVNTKAAFSTISAEHLQELKFSPFDYVYRLQALPPQLLNASIQDLLNIKIEKFVLAKELIFQDLNEGDVIVHSFLLHVAKDSSLGADFFGIFGTVELSEPFGSATQANAHAERVLAISLGEQEQLLMANTEIEPAYRDFMIANQLELKRRWQDYYMTMRSKLTAELTLRKSDEALLNAIEVTVDANSGYVKAVVFNEPSDSETFNAFCKNFIDSLKRFKALPPGLRDRYPEEYKLVLELKA